MNNTIQLCGVIWQKIVKDYPQSTPKAQRQLIQKQLQEQYNIKLCDSTIINYLSQYRHCNTKLPETWYEFYQLFPVRKVDLVFLISYAF